MRSRERDMEGVRGELGSPSCAMLSRKVSGSRPSNRYFCAAPRASRRGLIGGIMSLPKLRGRGGAALLGEGMMVVGNGRLRSLTEERSRRRPFPTTIFYHL